MLEDHAAWLTGKGTVIAILDSGINVKHTAFQCAANKELKSSQHHNIPEILIKGGGLKRTSLIIMTMVMAHSVQALLQALTIEMPTACQTRDIAPYKNFREE